MNFLQQPPRFLFFTGKGGVGKTSIACATAIELAQVGQRVLLVSTDPASNVGQVFGITIGNLRNKTFPEIWNSPEARALRGQIERKECYCTTEVFMWSSLPRPHRRTGARAAAG